MAEAKRRKTHCMYYMGTVPCKCDRCAKKDYDNCRKRDRYVKPSEEVVEALEKSRHMLVEDWFKEPASRCEICSEKSMICHIMDCKTCVEDKDSDSFHEGCPDCKNYGMYVSVWRCIIHCTECTWPATGLCWKHDEPYDSSDPTFKKMLKDGMVMPRADWVNGDGHCEGCDKETDYFSLKGDRERFVRPRRCGVHCKECDWDIGCVVTKEYCSRHIPPSQTWMGLAVDAFDDEDDDNDSHFCHFICVSPSVPTEKNPALPTRTPICLAHPTDPILTERVHILSSRFCPHGKLKCRRRRTFYLKTTGYRMSI